MSQLVRERRVRAREGERTASQATGRACAKHGRQDKAGQAPRAT